MEGGGDGWLRRVTSWSAILAIVIDRCLPRRSGRAAVQWRESASHKPTFICLCVCLTLCFSVSMSLAMSHRYSIPLGSLIFIIILWCTRRTLLIFLSILQRPLTHFPAPKFLFLHQLLLLLSLDSLSDSLFWFVECWNSKNRTLRTLTYIRFNSGRLYISVTAIFTGQKSWAAAATDFAGF